MLNNTAGDCGGSIFAMHAEVTISHVIIEDAFTDMERINTGKCGDVEGYTAGYDCDAFHGGGFAH
eukprot:167396-Prymnesium_polylepis.1